MTLLLSENRDGNRERHPPAHAKPCRTSPDTGFPPLQTINDGPSRPGQQPEAFPETILFTPTISIEVPASIAGSAPETVFTYRGGKEIWGGDAASRHRRRQEGES